MLHCINILAWSGNSLYLNPNEFLWSIKGTKVTKNNPRTKRGLQETIIKVWHYEIPEEMLQNLVDPMPNREAAMIGDRGGPTNY